MVTRLLQYMQCVKRSLLPPTFLSLTARNDLSIIGVLYMDHVYWSMVIPLPIVYLTAIKGKDPVDCFQSNPGQVISHLQPLYTVHCTVQGAVINPAE